MNLILIGMNHKTAPLELREKLALSCADPYAALAELKAIPSVEEALYISTCNRFELLARAGGHTAVDRLKDFRPAMVVVGPGLPEKDAPFKLPKDMGAKVFFTKEVEKPRFFHEHFTNTDSWILRSETIRLTSPGRYYLVAFSPQGQTGKLWLSIGKKESFSMDDFKQFPTWAKRIQEFHEAHKK